MKTKTTISPFLTMILTFFFGVLLIVSCKKSDDNPEPTPTPTPTPEIPPLFSGTKIPLLSNFEMARGKKSPLKLIYNACYSVRGEDPELPIPDLKEVADVVWEIHDYKHTEARFDNIDNEIAQLAGQITQLQQEISELSNQVSFITPAIITQFQSLVGNTYITDINDAFSSTNNNRSLRYYSYEASQNQSDTTFMNNLVQTCQNYFINVYAAPNPAPQFDMNNAINQIHTLIMGNANPPYDFTKSDLKSMSDLIITATKTARISDQTLATDAYLALENYFLSYLTAQYNALIVYANAYIGQDSASGSQYINQYINNPPSGFRYLIQNELKMFMLMVDYLACNMYDFRSSVGFSQAVTNLPYGIQEDNICGQFIARSNFINSLLMKSLGVIPSDFYITIALPEKYCSAQLGWMGNGVQYTTNKESDSITLGLRSQFPFTYWNGSTCNYDNFVSFYRGTSSNGANTNHFQLNSLPVAITGATWRHSSNLSGLVPFGYYDPNDWTKAPQSTYSSTFSLAFGSVSTCYPWGYFYLNDNANNDMYNCSDYEMGSPLNAHGPMPYVANSQMVQGNIEWGEYKDWENENNYMTWGDNSLGYNGPTSTTSQGFFLTNVRCASVNISSSSLVSGTAASLYCSYTTDPMDYSGTITQKWWGGTDISNRVTKGDLFNFTGSDASSGVVTAAMGSGSHSINFGFSSYLIKPTGHSHEMSLTFYTQVCYEGYISPIYPGK